MNTKLRRSSAGGVIIKDGQVLLIFSALRNNYAFPKGTIDEGETKEVAAVREVKEETGYSADIVDFLGEYTFEFDWKDGQRYQKTVTYYLMELTDDSAPVPDLQEGEDFVNMWVPFDVARGMLTFEDSKAVLALAIDRHTSTTQQ